jgi:signal transduction histidine kinase
MEKTKRRKYLVRKITQFRYMGLVTIPLIVLLVGLYYLIYYAVFNQMLIPEAIVTTLIPAMKKVNVTVAVTGPILFSIILRTALVYSNRIIGPVPRLERELDKVIAGDYSVRIKARDKDELRTLINKINMLLEKIDSRGRVA